MIIATMKDLNPPTQSMASCEQAEGYSFPLGRAVAWSPRHQRPGQLARSCFPFGGIAPFSLFNVRNQNEHGVIF
jgi:hypothetical protein